MLSVTTTDLCWMTLVPKTSVIWAQASAQDLSVLVLIYFSPHHSFWILRRTQRVLLSQDVPFTITSLSLYLPTSIKSKKEQVFLDHCVNQCYFLLLSLSILNIQHLRNLSRSFPSFKTCRVGRLNTRMPLVSLPFAHGYQGVSPANTHIGYCSLSLSNIPWDYNF